MAQMLLTVCGAALAGLIIYLAVIDVPVQSRLVTQEIPPQEYLGDDQ